jgi:hypothetical protein
MSDEPKITAARLRIVTNNGEQVPDHRTAPTASARRGGRMGGGLAEAIDVSHSATGKSPRQRFAQVSIDWLGDPAWQRLIPPHLRLYFLVQYLTKRGSREWPLTNSEASEIGLDRHHKHRYLGQLEQLGLVRVSRQGQHNPVVSLALPAKPVVPEKVEVGRDRG